MLKSLISQRVPNTRWESSYSENHEHKKYLWNVYFCYQRKPIRYKMAKPQTAMSITFAVNGFLLQFYHMSDWSKNNKHSKNNS